MIEVAKDMCLSLIREYGLFVSILFTLLLIVVFMLIQKNFKKIFLFVLRKRSIDFNKLFNKDKQKQLSLFKEFIFFKLNHLFNVRINEINCPCPLRQYLYKKIFRIKIQIFSQGLKNFSQQCQKQYNKQYYKQKVTTFFLQKHLQWKNKCVQQGIPKFVIDAVDEKIQPLRNMYYINLQRVFDNNYLYSNNKQRLVTILDMFLALQQNILNVCQQVLDSFNGQIKNLQLENVRCKNCCVCVHDQYLRKTKQNDNF